MIILIIIIMMIVIVAVAVAAVVIIINNDTSNSSSSSNNTNSNNTSTISNGNKLIQRVADYGGWALTGVVLFLEYVRNTCLLLLCVTGYVVHLCYFFSGSPPHVLNPPVHHHLNTTICSTSEYRVQLGMSPFASLSTHWPPTNLLHTRRSR